MTTMVGAGEAAALLGVTKPTLYAYVSRGMLERHVAVDGRTSLYPRDQVEALAARGRTRTTSERPSIDVQIASSITQLGDDALRYRGHDVAELARTASFESVAELLWTGTLPTTASIWSVDRRALERCTAIARAARDRDRGHDTALLALCAQALAMTDDEPSGSAAARTLLSIAPTVIGGPRRGATAERVTRALARHPSPELIDAVDVALVLLADHELATSTLAVRVACSVRANAHAALASGLAVVSGPLHGGASEVSATMLDRVATDGAVQVVGSYLDAGQRLPGFGHSVYRRGDPRVAPLLDAVRAIPGAGETVDAIDAVVAEAGRRMAHLPNVDLALGALLRAGGIAHDAPLFAVARVAGWGAHYDEERTERPVRFRGLTKLR